MIQKKKMNFKHDGVDFEATVTFNDMMFSEVRAGGLSLYYKVKLHKPIELDCGGEVTSAGRNFAMRMFLSPKLKNRHYFYKEDLTVLTKERNINVYPLAIGKVIYSYFNRDQIVFYTDRVKEFENALDEKYEKILEEIKLEKSALKKLLKSNVIDSKIYQTRLKPIRLKKEEIEFKVFSLKHTYKRRYFNCCELKNYYRIYNPETYEPCHDETEVCSLIKIVDKIQT